MYVGQQFWQKGLKCPQKAKIKNNIFSKSSLAIYLCNFLFVLFLTEIAKLGWFSQGHFYLGFKIMYKFKPHQDQKRSTNHNIYLEGANFLNLIYLFSGAKVNP